MQRSTVLGPGKPSRSDPPITIRVSPSESVQDPLKVLAYHRTNGENVARRKTSPTDAHTKTDARRSLVHTFFTPAPPDGRRTPRPRRCASPNHRSDTRPRVAGGGPPEPFCRRIRRSCLPPE